MSEQSSAEEKVVAMAEQKLSAVSGFLKEFRDFAVKGNAIDMAVGIVVGAAFNQIVTSLVNDVIMPPIGLLLGGVDFKDLQWVLKEAIESAPAVAIRYGAFLNTLISFIITAFSVFVMVKVTNALIRNKADAGK